MFLSSLEEIGSCSFKNCGKLKYINFGARSDLKKIGSYASRGCFRLEKIDFPPLLEVIEKFAFEDSEKIDTFDLSHTKVREIGFKALPVTTVYFPKTVSVNSITNNNSPLIQFSEDHPFIKSDENLNFYSHRTILIAKKSNKHVLIRHG